MEFEPSLLQSELPGGAPTEPAQFPETAHRSNDEDARLIWPLPSKMPFCFGAAGVTVLWCFFHNRVGLGILFWVLGIVFARLILSGGEDRWLLGLIGHWTISITLGVTGNRIAWEERGYRSLEELRRGESGWHVAGVIFFVLSIAGTLYSTATVR